MPTHPSAYSAPFPGLNMMSVMPPAAAGRQMYGTNNVMGAFAGIGGDDDRNKGAYDKNKQQAQVRGKLNLEGDEKFGIVKVFSNHLRCNSV